MKEFQQVGGLKVHPVKLFIISLRIQRDLLLPKLPLVNLFLDRCSRHETVGEARLRLSFAPDPEARRNVRNGNQLGD
jgi:hypothetical protein